MSNFAGCLFNRNILDCRATARNDGGVLYFDCCVYIQGLKMTDQELKDLLAKFAAENAAGFAALREAQAIGQAKWDKTATQFDTMKKMLDGVSKNQGSVAEEYFYKSLSKLPSLGGIRFDRVTPHFVAGRKGKQQEYDVVLVNGNSVAVVEVKYKAHVNDLPQVHAQVARFKEDCPEFKNYAIYGGIAGLSVPDEVTKAALAQGLFVLSREGRALTVQAQGMRAL